MNHLTQWLSSSTRAGHHFAEQALMQRFRGLGIDIHATRIAALHDLTKEIDPASLADLLGYSTKIMNIHAAPPCPWPPTRPSTGRSPSDRRRLIERSVIKNTAPQAKTWPTTTRRR